MEASTLQAPAVLARSRIGIGAPLLRFRSDDQLVALFRAGHDEAFGAIHDRYHKRLMAYARQMLPGRQDAEDALQDVFVRAYSGLRASDRELALRAWLFRVAHNRCVDELRRPTPPPPEVLQLMRAPVVDPFAELDTRESLRRLVEDVRRLPDQQRSALLMRELGGMSYTDLACSLGISVGAVKSLLVRARLSLARAAEARDTSCPEIREELIGAHDRGVRPNANARRHMRDCSGCRSFRRELRGVTRELAAFAPAAGPLGFLANVLGFSGGAGGGATAGGVSAGGGAAAATSGGAVVSAGGLVIGANHVAALIAAAVATAGGAVAIQHTIVPPGHRAHHVRVAGARQAAASPAALEQANRLASTAGSGRLAAPARPSKGSRVARTGGVGIKGRLHVTRTGGGSPVAPADAGEGGSGSTTLKTAGSSTAGALCGAATTTVAAASGTGLTGASDDSSTGGSPGGSSGGSTGSGAGSSTATGSSTGSTGGSSTGSTAGSSGGSTGSTGSTSSTTGSTGSTGSNTSSTGGSTSTASACPTGADDGSTTGTSPSTTTSTGSSAGSTTTGDSAGTSGSGSTTSGSDPSSATGSTSSGSPSGSSSDGTSPH